MAEKVIKNLKEFSTATERFEGSHLMCPGCAHSIIIREVLNNTDDELVIGNSTGCVEVCTAVYPYTSWDASWIHIGFENGSTAVAGAELMYNSKKKQGKWGDKKEPKFVAFGGDGATYDIGLQWISGCFARKHNFTYICLDNENYANTGGQSSTSTPIGASTSTMPAGSDSIGECYPKKSIVEIFAAHDSPYVAQMSPSKWKDMSKKVQRALNTEGPCFLNAVSACTTEWRFPCNKTIEMADLAVDSLVFPLYEIINGYKLNITYRPRNILSVKDYISGQVRFKHLLKPENAYVIERWQKEVEARWELLQRKEEATANIEDNYKS